MKLLFIRFLILTLLFSGSVFSQEKKEYDNQKTKQVSDIFSFKQGVSDYLQISQVGENRGNVSNNNNVTMIQQVGVDNIALTRTISNSSDLQYLQYGNGNTISNVNRAANIVERVQQNGVDNSVLNFSVSNLSTSNLNVMQSGNNLKFEKFGTNNQTNGLKFKMTGNNQTLIVRSF